jgi:hypothetical protein
MSRLFAVVCRAFPAVVGAAAASCAQVAGIENTVGAGNSIAVTRMSIGSTVVLSPVAPDKVSAIYFVASRDPSGYDRVSAVPDPNHGRLTSQVRTPAPVQVTLSDETAPIPRVFAFPGPQLSVLDVSRTPATSAVDSARSGNTLFGTLEHPGRQDAATGATFMVNVALDAAIVAGQTFQTYVVGAWLARPFSATEAPPTAMQIGPVTFGFTTANTVSGRSQVDQITADDAFLILRYAGSPTLTVLTGVAEAMPLAQSSAADAVTTPTFPTMMPVAPGPTPGMFSATVAQDVLANRYNAVRPGVAGPPAINWSVVAAPGYAYGSNAGPVLASGTVMMEAGPTAPYENPFAARGWNTIFTLATSASRVYMAPIGPAGMPVAITLTAGMNQSLEPPPSPAPPLPPPPPVALELPAGLPQVVTIGNTVLMNDGAFIKQSSQFYNVSFTVDGPASTATQGARFYNLQLFDLVLNSAMTGVDRVLVFAAAGKDPAFALPPELFQVGHSYTVRAVSTLGGFPGAEQGDFSHPQLPLAQSYLDGGVFTVTL